MRLFLVRHGETVDNVSGIYAGTTDSALTNHGVLQANRLGQHLANKSVKVSHIFSSDLARAFKTAEAIRHAQHMHTDEQTSIARQITKLVLLREQDFGSYEGKSVHKRSHDPNKSGREARLEVRRNDPGFKGIESKEAMTARSDTFIDEYLLCLFGELHEDDAVVVVAHGIILTHLLQCILRRFNQEAVSIASDVLAADRGLSPEYRGGWSNTGYLELEIKSRVSEMQASTFPAIAEVAEPASLAEAATSSNEKVVLKLADMLLVVKAVNSVEHLKELKKTKGGIGSSKHDEDQKTIESFFKKRKIG